MNGPGQWRPTDTLAGVGAGAFVTAELRREWSTGCKPPVVDFLNRHPKLSAADRVAVLRVDQELRWQSGERVQAEAYRDSFSELADQPDKFWQLVQNEILLRCESGETIELVEYDTRFPQYRDRVRKLNVGVDTSAKGDALVDTPTSLATIRLGTHGGGSLPVLLDLLPGAPSVPGYEIVEQVGRGSMGVIYKARSLKLKRFVALKMVIAGELTRSDHLERFRGEAETVARLQHPNIVQIFEVGELAGRPFLVLEYLDGGPLSRHLANKPIAPRDAAQLIATLANAMGHAHAQGIIHRDLKPGNVLLSHTPLSGPHSASTLTHSLSWAGANPQKTGPHFVPKIADFGLAKCLEELSTQTQTGEILGTPSYMSPEQAAGANSTVGPPTDVHALGAMLYEMLTGRPPFQGATPLDTVLLVKTEDPVPPTRLQPRLPPDLETICLKCLQKDPARRYPHAGALAEDVQRFLNGVPIQARPIGAVERAVKWMCRRPAYATLLLVIVGGSLAFFANTVFYNRQLRSALDAEAQQRKLAEQKESQARQAAERETIASEKANRQLVKLLLANGARQLDEGDLSSSLVWFAEALTAERATADSWDPAYLQREKTHRIRMASLLRDCPRLTQYWRLDNVPMASHFSSDGSRVVVLDSANAVRVYDVSSGLAIKVVAAASDVDRIAAVTRDASYAAAFVAKSHKLRLLDLQSQSSNDRTLQLPEPGHSASFSPDGKSLVVGIDRGLVVYDIATLQPRPMEAFDRTLNSVMFSNDGRCILGSSDGRSATMFDVGTLKPIGVAAPKTLVLVPPAVRHDCKAIAFLHDENEVWLWDVEAGRPLVEPMRHDGAVTSFAFSPDGMRLAVGCRDGQIVVWSGRHSRRVQTLRHRGKVTSLRYSPDGTTLLSASADQTTVVWDWLSGREAISPLRHGGASVLGASFASDGRRIVTHASDGGVRVWDLAAAVADRSYPHRRAKLRSAHFNPAGNAIVTVTEGGSATVFDRDGGGVPKFELPNESKVMRVEFSPDGQRIATRGDDGQVRVFDGQNGAALSSAIFVNNNPIIGMGWDASSRHLLFNLPYGFNVFSVAEQRDLARVGEGYISTSVYFLPDRKTVLNLSVVWGTHVRAYEAIGIADPGNAPMKYMFQIPAEAISVAIDPINSLMAIACSDGIARQFDWRTGKSFGGLSMRHGSSIGSVAYSHDGKRLATGSDDGTAMIWSSRTGSALTPALTHGSGVRQIQFSRDGAYLLTHGDDRTARVWDATNGLPVTVPIDPGEANWAEFSPDGRAILTACSDGIARIRHLQTEVRDSEELQKVATLLSGLRRQESLGLAPISPTEFESLWLQVREKYPKNASVLPSEAAAWHRASADDAAVDRLWGSAEFHLNQLLKFDPKSVSIQLRLAETLSELGKVDEALSILDKLIAARPDDLVVLRKRVYLHARRGAGLAALEDVRRIVDSKVGKDDGVAWLARSVVHASMGDQAAANDALDRVRTRVLANSQRDMSESSAWRSLIDDFLSGLLAERSTDMHLLRVRAIAQWALGRWDLAAADLQKATALGKGTGPDWHMLASSLRNLRRYEDALIACDKGIVADANMASLWRLKGQLHLLRRSPQPKEAADAFERVVAIKPTPQDWRQLGDACFMLRNASRAADAYQKAMDGPPVRYEVGYYLALAQLAAKREADFQATCRRLLAAAADPNAELDRNTVAWITCLHPSGVADYQSVVQIAQQAVQTASDKYAALNTLGAAYLRHGKPELAVDALSRALAANRQNGSAWDWYLLATAEAKRGRVDEAKRHLAQADAWLAGIREGKLPADTNSGLDRWENQIELGVLRADAMEAIRTCKPKSPSQ